MDIEWEQAVKSLLMDLKGYGYEWFSVRGILVGGSIPEDRELVDLFKRAEKLLDAAPD